jgi:hypothetical protein
MQRTKYTGRIDQLSTEWNFENCEKMVDEAYRLNQLTREAEMLMNEELFPFETEEPRRTVGIFGMVGWYARRFFWKSTR